MKIKNFVSSNAIIIFIFSLIALLVTSASYIFLNTKNILLKTNLTCNFRDKVYVKDFIYKLDGTLKNNYQIDTSVVGKKKVRVVYQDKHGFYKVTNFEIEIKDKVAPTILQEGNFVVNEGYDKNLEDEILCADDYDDNVKCSIEGSYNLEVPGIYPLTISAVDSSNNKTEKNFNLEVKEHVITNEEDDDSVELNFVDYNDIYRKYKSSNTMIGLDISKWQKEVDFKKLKTMGIEFVMIKLGGQTKINGDIIVDSYFKSNIEKAIREKIKVGIYVYSYAKNKQQAIKQADFVLKNIEKYNVDMPIAFDWENWDEYNKFNMSFNSLNNVAKAFMDRLENKGYDTLLYSSEYYLNNVWFDSDYNGNLWIANYGNLTYEGSYKMWQLCSDGKIDGIDTYVDIDVFYKNRG